MTRTGKIARLPRSIRHELNARLDDGAPGKSVIEWLKTLPEVNAILGREFEGRPITEQNLSEWKRGGFLDWQRQEEGRGQINRFVNVFDSVADATAQLDIPGRFARVLVTELAAETQRLLQATDDPRERFRVIGEALRQVNVLRKSGQSAERWLIECQRRERHGKEISMEEAREVLAESSSPLLKDPIAPETLDRI